jgi:hypothetical protein
MCVGSLDSPEFTGCNDTLIIGIRGREGTELDMGMGWILLCWPEDAIFSAAEHGLTQSGHGLVALSPSSGPLILEIHFLPQFLSNCFILF